MIFPNSASYESKLEGRELLDIENLYFSDKEGRKLIFKERLKLVNDDGDVVDWVTITVEPSSQGGGLFEILQASEETDHPVLKTKSLVSRKFETLSEIRKIRNGKTAKLMRVTCLPESYRLFMTETDLAQRTGTRMDMELSKPEVEPLLLEGANVLLLRKLALVKRFGQLKTYTLDNDGVLQDAEYTVDCLSHGEMQVTRVVGSRTMTTLLDTNGHIINHKWSDSEWRLESGLRSRRSRPSDSSPLSEQPLEDLGEEPPPDVNMPAYWQKKAEVIQELREYMVQYSGIQDLIADMMKNILFEKPEDPIDFADKYLSETMGISRKSDSESSEVDSLSVNSAQNVHFVL